MTTRTKALTMLAGGICSLAIASAASAGHDAKTIEVCDKGSENANVWIQRHGDGSEGRKFSIKLNTDDGPIVFGSDDFDFDFDFDMDFDFEWDSDDHGGIHDVLIKKLGGMHGDHGKQVIKLHKEHLAKAPKALHTKKLHLQELHELHGLHELLELKGHGGGQHEVIIERLHGHDDDFSMGDLGLDDDHGDGQVEVIIKEIDGQHGDVFVIKGGEGKVWASKNGQTIDLADHGGGVFVLRGDDHGKDVRMKIEKEAAKAKVKAEKAKIKADVIKLKAEKAKVKAKAKAEKAKAKSKRKGLHTDARFNVEVGAGQGGNVFAWASEDDQARLPEVKQRYMIGVTLGSISEALASQLGVDAGGVVMIESVTDGMPASESGLRRFDVITKVDGKAPVSTPMLQKIISGKSEGDLVKVEVLRGGDAKTFKVGLAQAPAFPERIAFAERAEREAVRARERELRNNERALVRADRNLARAQERMQRSKELAEVRRSKGGEDLKAIMKHLESLDVELDEETMAELHEHLAELGEHMHSMDFTFEMPNIEFVPGEGDEDAFVVIEGAPDGRFFERDGNTIHFAPRGGQGEFRFEVAPTPPAAPVPGENVFFERNTETAKRLNSLEERMERIERMLEKIAERID